MEYADRLSRAGLVTLFLVALGGCVNGQTGNDLVLTDVPAPPDAFDAIEATDTAVYPDAREIFDSSIPDAFPDATADDADIDVPADTAEDVPDSSACVNALPLTCGDSFSHSTLTNGRENMWGGYNCTARAESGRETVYRFEYENACLITVTLSDLSTDLDVMHLESCDAFSADECASTPLDIQDDETIVFVAEPGVPTWVVVDGYNGSEGTYTIDASCDCGEPLAEYRSGMVECAFQYVDSTVSTPALPDSAPCLPEPCGEDLDCTAINTIGAGQMCVFGNCVYCAEDTDCPESLVCRAGRCITKGETDCPVIPDCVAVGCGEAYISETSCQACLCTTEFFNACAVDDDCLPISHHPFLRCVNGRCAECRVDSDCGNEFLQCLPPGMCMSMLTHPSAIYGSWLIGWYGAFNHFSYFRFEADGTLRRATYDPTGPAGWADDIFLCSCPGAFGDGASGHLVGTWEPVMTESGFLVVSIDFRAICDPEAEGLDRWVVTMDEGGDGFTMKSVEYPEGIQMTGVRIAPGLFCNDEFSSCVTPDDVLF